jgi:1,4-dihydroxy-2-naphthoate octaprenyltransferase
MTQSPSLAAIWWKTTRPKTLFAALAPVSMGAVLALDEAPLQVPVLLATLGVALFIQIGTNFCNDVFDHVQGADTEDRQGPLRGLHAGQLSWRTMVWATGICFGLAAVLSGLLFLRGGMPIFWLAVASILSGIFYTAGRHSLAYTGFADLFVVTFFGPIAVGGTYYLQLPEAGWPPVWVWVAGLGPGLIATALLTVNNLRDVEEDRVADKRTLAVRFGRRFSRLEYSLCMLGALITPAAAAGLAGRGVWSVSVLFLLPWVVKGLRGVWRGTTGAELNPVLGLTGLTLLRYALLFVLTWPLGR